MARTVVFNKLSEDGRIAVQSVRDQTENVMKDLSETSHNAERILEEVRAAAAKQGVTQQARYFADEADFHNTRADNWKTGLFVGSGVVFVFAVSTLFFRYIPFLTANSLTEAVQLAASKILVFVVLFYILVTITRNYNAHKHNSVVNKHRQNALMTFSTLAEAGNNPEARDVVLQHAAAAIYAPNDSGYIKNEERGYTSQLPVSVTPKLPISGSDAG